MKISVKEFCVSALYILAFISAIGQLRYQLYEQTVWNHIYLYSLYAIIVVSVFYLMFSWVSRVGKIPVLEILLLLFVAYEVFISFATGMLYIKPIIRDVLPWPLLLVVFYDYASKFSLPKMFKSITFVGIVLISVLSVPNIARHLVDYGRRGGVIFPIYYGMGFLAMAMLMFKRKAQYAVMILEIILLTVSTKRTGTAAVVVGIIAYFLCDAFIENSLKEKMKKYFRYGVLFFIAVVIGLFLINHYNISILERFASISEDSGSNRAYIWADVMQHFYDSSLLSKIFGHGFHAVYYKVQPYGYQRMAHNSFMETLYDYGIVGLVMLLGLVLYLIVMLLKMIKRKNHMAPVMFYTMSPMLLLGLFSYFFEQTVVITPFVIVWGICCGSFQKEKQLAQR